MKAEITEKSVKFIPENDWDKKVLEAIRKNGVEHIRFENEWDASGALELIYPEYPWGM